MADNFPAHRPQHTTNGAPTFHAAFDLLNVITPLTGGASGAFPFRVEIGDRRYLVRVEGLASPLRNPHQYNSMRIAADAGIAPRIYHIDEAARVAVMDYIEEKPLSTSRADLARSPKQWGKFWVASKRPRHFRISLNIQILLAAYGRTCAEQAHLRPARSTRTQNA